MQNGELINLKIFTGIYVDYNTVYTIFLGTLLRNYFPFCIQNVATKVNVIP